MSKRTISVTEAARNFADCVNRVRYQKVTFILLKNGLPVASLGPEVEKRCTGRDLAKALASKVRIVRLVVKNLPPGTTTGTKGSQKP